MQVSGWSRCSSYFTSSARENDSVMSLPTASNPCNFKMCTLTVTHPFDLRLKTSLPQRARTMTRHRAPAADPRITPQLGSSPSPSTTEPEPSEWSAKKTRSMKLHRRHHHRHLTTPCACQFFVLCQEAYYELVFLPEGGSFTLKDATGESFQPAEVARRTRTSRFLSTGRGPLQCVTPLLSQLRPAPIVKDQLPL